MTSYYDQPIRSVRNVTIFLPVFSLPRSNIEIEFSQKCLKKKLKKYKHVFTDANQFGCSWPLNYRDKSDLFKLSTLTNMQAIAGDAGDPKINSRVGQTAHTVASCPPPLRCFCGSVLSTVQALSHADGSRHSLHT